MNKKIIITLAVLGLFFRLVFMLLVPPFEGNDEPAHLRYTQHLLIEGRLPNLYLYKSEPVAGNEYFQPPLYYFLSAQLIKITKNSFNQLYILRTFSIFLWLLTFYFSYKIMVQAKLTAWLTTSVLVFVALLPSYIFNSATVNNDALIILLTTFVLYLIILWLKEQRLDFKKLFFLAFLSALAILTKLNGLVIIPTVILAIFILEKRKNLFVGKTIIYFSLVVTLSFWWFLYNFLTYQNWLGPIKESTGSFNKIPFDFYKIYLILRGTFATFWISYGPANEIRLPITVYFFLLIITILSLIGVFVHSIKAFVSKKFSLTSKSYLIIFGILVLSNLILLFIFNINQFQPLGRYLFISLPSISTFLVIGLSHIIPTKFAKLIPVFLIVLLIGLNFFGIKTLIDHNN
jgi:4-amino-4-deoxy-L-arabinose transferase-like glycosyltransferase